MRSDYELDIYFASKNFRKRLDYFRKLGEGYEISGAIYIVHRFGLMQYHYGIISHYIETGKYDPGKANRHQIEIIEGTESVHLSLPPGIKRGDIIAFIEDNFNKIKAALNNAYQDDTGHKSAFRPVERIDDYLAVVDEIDRKGGPSARLITELSVDYKIDESDIRKIYKKYGDQSNPYLEPV